MQEFTKTLTLGGRTISFEINAVAQQATASVITRYGETTILTTVVVGRENPNLDYFPLSLEYVEKLYAGGRIKGSRWVKREGRPNDSAILTSRLIDRSVRPLFHDDFKNEVQVINTVLSIDGVNAPEEAAVLSACCALSLCSIPWNGPVAILNIGFLKDSTNDSGHYVINPTTEEEILSPLELTVAYTKDRVVMIETKGEEVSKELIKDGIKFGRGEADKIINLFNDLRQELKIKEFVMPTAEKDLLKIAAEIAKKYQKPMLEKLKVMADKENVSNSSDELTGKLMEEFSLDEKEIGKVLKLVYKKVMKHLVFEKKERADGRKFDEVRKLSVKVGVIPRVHGSAIFKRGATEVLSIATLGPLSLQQLIENPEGEFSKRYIHHYYMPPYSVGETGRIGVPNRREIGHGALAEKAVEIMLPNSDKFPYAIRVVSEVLSSNGSTSMASTCGSSLALMDAGVPIKEQIAGIAIGIVRESKDKYQLLTDIIGIEDFFGQMDFKVAGTKNGITAIQLDVKTEGLTDKTIDETLDLAENARLSILDTMNKAISGPRKELSRYAPRVVILTPPADKIGEIIGPGGKNIKKLVAETGCDIDITDDGKVSISGVDPKAVELAVERIGSVSKVYKVGDTFIGSVIKVLAFGAIIEIGAGKEGLLHVSKMGMGFVKDANDVFQVGQKVEVEIEEMDDRGRLKLKLIKKV